jgi:hypothetical protein
MSSEFKLDVRMYSYQKLTTVVGRLYFLMSKSIACNRLACNRLVVVMEGV